MGNSLHSKEYIDLGRNGSIRLHRDDYRFRDQPAECWTFSYDAGWLIGEAMLGLDRIIGKNGETLFFRLQFMDHASRGGSIHFFVGREEKELLHLSPFYDTRGFYGTRFVNETENDLGSRVTETNVFVSDRGSKGNLLVVEQKGKKGDKFPCMVTVTHYYAVSSTSLLRRNKIDIGLSIAVDIQWSNGDLVFSAEGPDRHPASALLYMFQEVSRTKTWNPTLCPHCAAETQRQSNGVKGQSRSTENERDESRNVPLPAPLHSPTQNGGAVLANQGFIQGNYNGNFLVNQLILKLKEDYKI